MLAFKILNLRTCSEKLIAMLLSLSIGLVSLIFTALSLPGVPIPHFPFSLTIPFLSVNYALSGLCLLHLYNQNKKESLMLPFLFSVSFFISIITPPLILRYNAFFLSFLLSLSSVLLIFQILRKRLSFNSVNIFLFFHLLTDFYMLYLSLSFFF